MNIQRPIRLSAVVAVLTATWVIAPTVRAQPTNPVNVTDVTVLPFPPITPADEVSLDILLESGTAEIELRAPTSFSIVGNDIFVDIFAASGLLTILDSQIETVDLGTLVAGIYNYEVMQNGPTTGGPVSGTFEVVPEPGTVTLVSVITAIVLCHRRRRASDS